jgi:hypothetical protein
MQALAGFDVLLMVDPATLAKIKERDPHPLLQAYSICHEGTSNPTVLGEGARSISWFRRAVQSIKNVIVKGVKFFLDHNADNSTEGREALGEVVASGEKEIEGTLHHVVVGYFPNKEKVADLDICSQEAEWDLAQTATGWVADKIAALTGIALSSSKRDKPAFPGAVRLGMVQAFENKIDGGQDGGQTLDESRRYPMDLAQATFPELLAEMQKRQVKPLQVFTREQLEADQLFSPTFEKAKAHDELKKNVDDLTAKLTTAEADKSKLSGDLNAMKRAVEFTKAPKRLGELMKAANYTEKQAAFILKRLTDKVEDVTDAGLQKFAQEQVAIYNDVAGVGTDSATGASSAASTSASGQTSNDPNDLTKKVNNPLLEEDV